MQFKANAKEKDPTKIEALKSDAIRALSNYMVYQSAQKDTRLQKAINLNKRNTKTRDEKDILNDFHVRIECCNIELQCKVIYIC